jgi:hypothetical protein
MKAARSPKPGRYEVERINVRLTRSFPKACAALEEPAPIADVSAFAQMVSSGWDARRIERAIEGMVGELGFMILGKLEHGLLVSILGKTKKMTLYLLRNPVLANRSPRFVRAGVEPCEDLADLLISDGREPASLG